MTAVKKISTPTLTPEEMDEAKKELEQKIQDHIKKCLDLDIKFPITYTAKKFFELGLKAQIEKAKEQMMTKAIDAELYSDGMLTPIIRVKDKEKISNIKFGDKVKLIIIKEDENE